MKKILAFISNNRMGVGAYVKTLSPLVFLAVVAISFEEFVVRAIEAEVAINAGIIGVALYGAFIIVMRLTDAFKDYRVIERFGREVHDGADMKEILEQPWIQARSVRHYLSHIANTGGKLSSQVDQNAIESELHALQKEYDNKLELPQFIVGFMIAMGLLGTFIGLLETLTGISGMLDGMGNANAGSVDQQFMKLVGELRKPLAGMGIAFSASMFGLIGSLMLAAMMINLRRYIGHVISLARNTMHELIEIVSHSVSVTQKEEAPAASGAASGVSATMLVGRFDLLSKKIEMIIETIQTSTASTQRLVDLLGFGPRMRDLTEKSLEELRTLSGAYADGQKSIQQLIEATNENLRMNTSVYETLVNVKDATEGTMMAVKSLSSSASEHQQVSRQQLDVETSLARSVSDLFFAQKKNEEFRDILLSEFKNITNSQNDQKKLITRLVELGGATTQGLEGVAQGQKQAANSNVNTLQSMIESVQKLDETGIGSARHLWDIKEKLSKLYDNFNMVELIATGVSSQTVLLETLIEEIRRAQGDAVQEPVPTEQEGTNG